MWVVVTESEYFRAQIIKTKLESENIPVKLQRETIGLLYGITFDGLGGVKILVPEEYQQKAEVIINAQRSD
ncbi:MAG: DUF2007 domain-containing protein [Candidatus Omnitrophica bacterium]|nr:DUF2007 domain-containing protein [Candidatus Omnitrophota bacterium]